GAGREVRRVPDAADRDVGSRPRRVHRLRLRPLHPGTAHAHVGQSASMKELLVEDVDAVRVITFNRPEAKNALSRAMRDEFCSVVSDADRDPSVKAIVITGTDPIFTAGVDFKEKNTPSDPRDRGFSVNPGSALRA